MFLHTGKKPETSPETREKKEEIKMLIPGVEIVSAR